MQPSAAASRGGRRMLRVVLTTQTFYLSKLLRNGTSERKEISNSLRMLIGKEFLVLLSLFQGGKHEIHILTRRMRHLEAVTVQRLLRTVKKLQNQFDKGLKGAAEKSRAVHGGPVSWVSLALLVVTGIGLLLYWDQEKKWQLKAPIEALLQIAYTMMQSDGAAVARTGPGVGKAAIGDICPDEVTKLAESVDEIGIEEGGEQILPVFISIDPEYDTVNGFKII
ncbi:unnamed protein product [Sphagnum compactum]